MWLPNVHKESNLWANLGTKQELRGVFSKAEGFRQETVGFEVYLERLLEALGCASHGVKGTAYVMPWRFPDGLTAGIKGVMAVMAEMRGYGESHTA